MEEGVPMQNLRQYIFDKLAENSRKYPGKKAIECLDESLTYQEVDIIVNNRAYYFKEVLGTENLPVAIRLKDKKETLLTMIALIKAGKAILPLPYEIPTDKAALIMKEICPQALISEDELASNSMNELMFIAIEKIGQLENIEAINNRFQPISYHEEALFCILMTSGTTGIPKGCQLSDQAFLGRIFYLSTNFPMLTGDKFLFSGNYSFDVTFTQMFCWLFGEGSIVIQSEKDKFNKIPLYVEQFNITHLAISPSILRHIYEDIKAKGNALKYVFVAGEKFPVEIAEKYIKEKPAFELLNLYGPTEFSIYATKYAIADYKGENSVSIGTALNGVKIHLIDEKGEIIKQSNTEGEIVLAGKGIFNGYINNVHENKQKLILINGELAYKTGDLGYCFDERYYLVGRKDHQFKINGVRVEAEEIENKILQHNPLIREAVVSYESYNTKNILVAYISWKDKAKKISDSQITKNIEKSLEKSFLPKFIITLDELPLNKNGKVDRVILQKLFVEKVAKTLTTQPLAAKEKISNILKNIWESVLQFPLKNDATDFFLSGGDSIDCVVMITELEEKFGVTLSEEEFIGHSTFKQLLSLITAKMKKTVENETEKCLAISWEDLGESIINDNDEKIIIANGEGRLYELVNAGLPTQNKVDKILIMENKKPVTPQVIGEFPLFSRQEFYLRRNFDSILQTSVVFEFPNYPKLIVALNKFIENQQLTRSLIINHRFVEFSYSPITLKNLNFIDLAFLGHKQADKLLNEKIKNIHAQLIQKSPDKQLLSFLLVRETLNRAKLYLFVSHHIADAASLNVFKTQILSYYQKNEVPSNIPSYEQFVTTVLTTNDKHTLLELSKSAYYQEICLANNSFSEFFQFDRSISLDTYVMALTTKNKEERANQLFAELANLVHKKTGANTFAFQILKNLRYFANVDYKDIFADMHCSIYTVYHANHSADKKLFSKSEQNFKQIYELKGIHIDYLTSSDAFYNCSLISSFEKTFLNLNYLGEVRKEEVPVLIEELSVVSEQLAKLHSNKIRFTCFSSGDRGYIISLGGISLTN